MGSAALVVIAVVVALAGLRAATAVFLPVCIAYFAAVLLEPLVAWGERRGVARKLGALGAVAFFLIAVGLGLWVCYQPFAKLYADLPQYEDKLKAASARLERRAQSMTTKTRGIIPDAGAGGAAAGGAAAGPGGRVQKVQVVQGPKDWSKYALAGLGSLAEAVGLAVFVPFFILFLLIEKDILAASVERLLAARFDPARIEKETPTMVRGYFIGNLVAALALGAIQTALFLGIGLENPVALGVVTGLFNVVPILGLPAALLPPVLQALVQGTSAGSVWLIAGGIVCLHLFMANFVEPRWIANRIRLNSFAATLAMLFGGWGWGIVGFLLAIPLTAQVRIVLETSPQTASWAALAALRPRAERRHGGPGLLARLRGSPRERQSAG